VRDRVIAAINRSLNEAGIDMPYPTTQILFHDQTEETDGDPLAATRRLAGKSRKSSATKERCGGNSQFTDPRC